eukprot:TRINITY_DN55919_c0_g1_i1.p1 TRINITY_DN55919_c0_g1~~TRINITY_DN55919_c0_g1_i1.p1  ORF type:complete len:500 (+),score=90.82 TRINITY_DN55919_c0_g1_i1:152-1651(+)
MRALWLANARIGCQKVRASGCQSFRRGLVATTTGPTLADRDRQFGTPGTPCGLQGGMTVFRGTVVHSKALGQLEVLPRGAVAVGPEGTVMWCASEQEHAQRVAADERGVTQAEVRDVGTKLVMPGFVDTHAHAPQYAFAGTAMDLELLEWLERYTFPVEAKCGDPDVARAVFSSAVAAHLRHGTTTCAFFATIHLSSANILAEECRRQGLRALVGKVSMDRNAPDFYCETTSAALDDTVAFVEGCLDHGGGLVLPIITPRFVPTCSAELMGELGKLARRENLHVQSHLGENKGEIAWVKELHPECDSYAGVYERYGLLGEKTIMAHCIYLEERERALLAGTGTGVSHCANSNFTLGSGICGVRGLLEGGIRVGLGTDVAGGYSPSMLNAIRMSSVASHARRFLCTQEEARPHLSFPELLHLATQGGAEVLGLGDRVGNFLPGKQFDAIVVDPIDAAGPIDHFVGVYPESGSPLDLLEKFLFNGDDRNVLAVYTAGQRVL